MSIDVLINTYDLELKKSQKEKGNVLTRKREIDKKSKRLFYALVLSINLYCQFLLRNEILIAFIFMGISFILALITSLCATRDQMRRKRINAEAENIKNRIDKLIDLLNKYNFNFSSETIEELITATKENQIKYDLWISMRRFSRTIASGMSLLIAIISSLFGSINDINTSSIISFIIVISFWYILYLILFTLLYCVFMSEFDPLVRRMYHFHDSFIYDLRQLQCFINYYVSSKEETSINTSRYNLSSTSNYTNNNKAENTSDVPSLKKRKRKRKIAT